MFADSEEYENWEGFLIKKERKKKGADILVPNFAKNTFFKNKNMVLLVQTNTGGTFKGQEKK